MRPIKITVVQGDITESSCDAIVNAANNHLWMGAGVAGAIKRRGGNAIEREAVAKGPIKSGDAVATTGGMLLAKHVIHAAGMGQDLKTSEHLIRQSTESSLRVADELGLKSVAFPAIGTGVGGFDAAECARIMIAAVTVHSPVSIESVEFVLFDAAASAAFESALADVS